MADRIATVDDLAKTAADLGRLALGLTDHGSGDGLLAFRSACRWQQIGVILSDEIYVTPGTDRRTPRA